MRPVLGVALAVAPLAALPSVPARAQYYCPACPVESKTPSTAAPGQFDFKMNCTDQYGGGSVIFIETAPNYEQARIKVWRSPRLDEVMVGMEINGYACAEIALPDQK
jgi:coenzyme PQQ precursor peptide PqqA